MHFDSRIYCFFINIFLPFIFIIRITMHSPEQIADIDSQFKNFLHLLRKNQQSFDDRSPLDTGKLSTIFSASEPQSSRQKENSNISSNTSFTSTQLMQIDTLIIEQLQKSGLTGIQAKYLEKIKRIIKFLKKNLQTMQLQLHEFKGKYQQQKKGTDQLLKALAMLDQSQKEAWKVYDEISHKFTVQNQKLTAVQIEKQQLLNKIVRYKKDNFFLKNLVIVANENYQILEKKYVHIEDEVKNNQLSSRSFKEKSSKNKRSAYSPTASDRSNLSQRKELLEENYRKIVLRTLRNKSKKKVL